VRSEIEEKAGQKFGEYKALKVMTQVVAGTNYFVKVSHFEYLTKGKHT